MVTAETTITNTYFLPQILLFKEPDVQRTGASRTGCTYDPVQILDGQRTMFKGLNAQRTGFKRLDAQTTGSITDLFFEKHRPHVPESQIGCCGVTMTLPDVGNGAHEALLLQEALEVELQLYVIVVRHHANSCRVLADLEHGDDILNEPQLPLEVGAPDAVRGVQQEGHVCGFVSAIFPHFCGQEYGSVNETK